MEKGHNPFKDGFFPQGQKRFERSHAPGFSRSEDDGDYGLVVHDFVPAR